MPPDQPVSFETIHSPQGVVHVLPPARAFLEAAPLGSFEDWMALQIPFREVSMRPLRPVVALEIPGIPKALFLKRHLEAPRKETLFQKMGLTQSLSEARKEVAKLRGFSTAGIHVPEVIAWGEGTWQGIKQASFIVTLDLEALPLERYLFRNWQPPLNLSQTRDKQEVLRSLAQLTRQMHKQGWVHRDFYLGHVFIGSQPGEPPQLSVIDVQRASWRPRWWLRSRIKDLASLHFSGDPKYIRNVDRMRFLKTYWDTSRFSWWQRFLIGWIRRKALRIRQHTEKSMKIPYSQFFDNKYY